MKLRCPECGIEYDVPVTSGQQVRCAQCNHVWRIGEEDDNFEQAVGETDQADHGAAQAEPDGSGATDPLAAISEEGRFFWEAGQRGNGEEEESAAHDSGAAEAETAGMEWTPAAFEKRSESTSSIEAMAASALFVGDAGESAEQSAEQGAEGEEQPSDYGEPGEEMFAEMGTGLEQGAEGEEQPTDYSEPGEEMFAEMESGLEQGAEGEEQPTDYGEPGEEMFAETESGLEQGAEGEEQPTDYGEPGEEMFAEIESGLEQGVEGEEQPTDYGEPGEEMFAEMESGLEQGAEGEEQPTDYGEPGEEMFAEMDTGLEQGAAGEEQLSDYGEPGEDMFAEMDTGLEQGAAGEEQLSDYGDPGEDMFAETEQDAEDIFATDPTTDPDPANLATPAGRRSGADLSAVASALASFAERQRSRREDAYADAEADDWRAEETGDAEPFEDAEQVEQEQHEATADRWAEDDQSSDEHAETLSDEREEDQAALDDPFTARAKSAFEAAGTDFSGDLGQDVKTQDDNGLGEPRAVSDTGEDAAAAQLLAQDDDEALARTDTAPEGEETWLELEDERAYDDGLPLWDPDADPQSLAAQQADAATRRASSVVVLAGWGLFLAVLAGLGLGAVGMRAEIIQALPASAAVYRAAGFSVPEAGENKLALESVGYQWVETDGAAPHLRVSGVLINRTGKDLPARIVYLVLHDEAGAVVAAKQLRPNTAEIAGGSHLPFTIDIDAPPEKGGTLSVSFEREEALR